jgi:hypothetical protein
MAPECFAPEDSLGNRIEARWLVFWALDWGVVSFFVAATALALLTLVAVAPAARAFRRG